MTAPPWTIARVVTWTSKDLAARGNDSARLDAELLIASALKLRRLDLYLRYDQPLDDTELGRIRALIERRRKHEPVAYILGERDFYGRTFTVDRRVLIPRPETEDAVAAVLERLPPRAEGVAPRVLDLGTGSGVVAITIALERPDVSVVATDVSEAALEVARANVAALCPGAALRVRLLAGAWFDALAPGERFETIVSNPPYVAAADEHLSRGDLRFEPRTALTDGGDGLSALRAIVAGAPARLAPGGALALEHGWDQGAAVRAQMTDAGFAGVATLADAEGRERVTHGRLAPGASGRRTPANEPARARDRPSRH